MNFTKENRKEVYDFFENLLKTLKCPVHYNNLRGYVNRAPLAVRQYVIYKCKGEKFLEYFQTRKNYFTVDSEFVSLRKNLNYTQKASNKLNKIKRLNTKKMGIASQNCTDSCSLSDLNSPDVPTAILSKEESYVKEEKLRQFSIKFFILRFTSKGKCKIDDIDFEILPKKVKYYVSEYFDSKLICFFFDNSEIFLVENNEYVSLRTSRLLVSDNSSLNKEMASNEQTENINFEPKQCKDIEQSMESDSDLLDKTKTHWKSLQFFINILKVKSCEFDKLGCYLSQASEDVRDFMKFNFVSFKKFILFHSNFFKINNDQVTLCHNYNEILSSINNCFSKAEDGLLSNAEVHQNFNILLRSATEYVIKREAYSDVGISYSESKNSFYMNEMVTCTNLCEFHLIVHFFCLGFAERYLASNLHFELEAVLFFVDLIKSYEGMPTISRLKGSLGQATRDIISYMHKKYKGDNFSVFFKSNPEFSFGVNCVHLHSNHKYFIKKRRAFCNSILGSKLYNLFNSKYFNLFLSEICTFLSQLCDFLKGKKCVNISRINGLISNFPNCKEFVTQMEGQDYNEKIRIFLQIFCIYSFPFEDRVYLPITNHTVEIMKWLKDHKITIKPEETQSYLLLWDELKRSFKNSCEVKLSNPEIKEFIDILKEKLQSCPLQYWEIVTLIPKNILSKLEDKGDSQLFIEALTNYAFSKDSPKSILLKNGFIELLPIDSLFENENDCTETGIDSDLMLLDNESKLVHMNLSPHFQDLSTIRNVTSNEHNSNLCIFGTEENKSLVMTLNSDIRYKCVEDKDLKLVGFDKFDFIESETNQNGITYKEVSVTSQDNGLPFILQSTNKERIANQQIQKTATKEDGYIIKNINYEVSLIYPHQIWLSDVLKTLASCNSKFRIRIDQNEDIDSNTELLSYCPYKLEFSKRLSALNHNKDLDDNTSTQFGNACSSLPSIDTIYTKIPEKPLNSIEINEKCYPMKNVTINSIQPVISVESNLECSLKPQIIEGESLTKYSESKENNCENKLDSKFYINSKLEFDGKLINTVSTEETSKHRIPSIVIDSDIKIDEMDEPAFIDPPKHISNQTVDSFLDRKKHSNMEFCEEKVKKTFKNGLGESSFKYRKNYKISEPCNNNYSYKIKTDNDQNDYPMKIITAKVILLSGESCVAQAKVHAKNQNVYFVKPVLSCGSSLCNSNCFDSLLIGDIVSCYVSPTITKNKIWIAFQAYVNKYSHSKTCNEKHTPLKASKNSGSSCQTDDILCDSSCQQDKISLAQIQNFFVSDMPKYVETESQSKCANAEILEPHKSVSHFVSKCSCPIPFSMALPLCSNCNNRNKLTQNCDIWRKPLYRSQKSCNREISEDIPSVECLVCKKKESSGSQSILKNTSGTICAKCQTNLTGVSKEHVVTQNNFTQVDPYELSACIDNSSQTIITGDIFAKVFCHP